MLKEFHLPRQVTGPLLSRCLITSLLHSPVTSSRMTHLYTLVIRGDNSFEILVDMESKKKGSLLEVDCYISKKTA